MCTRPEPRVRMVMHTTRTGTRCRAFGGTHSKQTGLTLVELVVALTLAAVLMSAIWSAWSLMGKGAQDPLSERQQLAIAQSLLREIELQPLPGTATAGTTAGRTGFASISDYNGLTLNPITDAEGTAVPGLEGYRATIAVTAQGLNGIPSTSGWWVSVTVTGPDGHDLKLAQWRSKR